MLSHFLLRLSTQVYRSIKNGGPPLPKVNRKAQTQQKAKPTVILSDSQIASRLPARIVPQRKEAAAAGAAMTAAVAALTSGPCTEEYRPCDDAMPANPIPQSRAPQPAARQRQAGCAASGKKPLVLQLQERLCECFKRPQAPGAAAAILNAYGANEAASDPGVRDGCQRTLWCDVGALTPGQLMRGQDPNFWGALRAQGAVMVHIQGTWDFNANDSAVGDVDWLHGINESCKKVKEEFHYMLQTLPRVNGDCWIAQCAIDSPDDKDVPFGQRLEEMEGKFQWMGTCFSSLSVPDREQTFMEFCRMDRPVQFPYLLGITPAALGSRKDAVTNGILRTIPVAGAHAWETSSLAILPGSILTDVLKSCEAVCNPDMRKDVRAADASAVNAGPSSQTSDTAAGASLQASIECAEALMDDFAWGAGIVTPWLYFMGYFSVFGAHFEDYAFGSANTILAPPDSGAAVIWYSVPREDLAVMHEFMAHIRGEAYTINCLEDRHIWPDPKRVAAWNETRQREGKPQLRVHRHVQGPGEYVITDYGAVHWGVNLGVGWKSAVNFACEEWHAAAQQVDAVYTELERKTGATRHSRTCPRLEADPVAKLAFQPERLRATSDASTSGGEMLPPLEVREKAGQEAYAAALARLDQRAQR